MTPGMGCVSVRVSNRDTTHSLSSASEPQHTLPWKQSLFCPRTLDQTNTELAKKPSTSRGVLNFFFSCHLAATAPEEAAPDVQPAAAKICKSLPCLMPVLCSSSKNASSLKKPVFWDLVWSVVSLSGVFMAEGACMSCA